MVVAPILFCMLGAYLFAFVIRGTLEPRAASQVWKMHKIDNPGFLLPNGLDEADVNKDGFMDYVTNYEFDGRIRVAFHPGLSAVSDPWPAVTVGLVPDAENAAFGDFDGDGNVDVVVAHGNELSFQAGVLIIWGPESARVTDGSAWVQGADIEGTVNAGQFNYVRSYDINGDGLDDIVVGGRGVYPQAGLKWIEAPLTPADRRNSAAWRVHDIDDDLEGAHGFGFGDVDSDGEVDLTVCNADWDTPDLAEKVVWYDNPSAGTEAQRQQWRRHIIYQGPEFYGKEQVTLCNVTRDAYPEVIMQTENDIYLFTNPGPGGGDSWALTKIAKAPETQWRARAIKIGDVNNDSRPDIVGMLIHRDGSLPTDKAAVFWMENSGNPLNGSWQTHVIKWGDGFTGFGALNGEKWDQCLLQDVDRDGDLDVVANCEEFNVLGFVYIAVVWFENPLVNSLG